ncbi:MAG: response regulator [Desulfobacterales bacterium]|nr:response regulator [Desulfobacterales bacterium]
MQPIDNANYRVLLVDDEADIRDVLSMSISDMGFEVICAENGLEGLEKFQSAAPHIVLTDIKMPVMDGIELLKRIKQKNPETEVVMITGHGDMELAIESLKHEATDFITKPINVDALEIALTRTRDKIVMRRKLADYTRSLESLIREKTDLQDRLASLGLMISTVSHGIKGLLTGLDGGMYMMNSGFSKEDPGNVAEGWIVVKMMVDRIRKMIMDILYYAKDRPLEWETVPVKAFADDVIKAMAAKADAGGIEIVHEIDPDPGTLEMDSAAVLAAIINVLDNAVDACVRDENKAHHRIIFSVRADASWVLFSIEDNGIGMDRQTRDQLFTLFFSSKGIRGTGLGLFITNNIIGQHGGDIQVSSTPGRGSRFVIRLPRNLPSAIKGAVDSEPEP